jgi:hypothetical protein
MIMNDQNPLRASFLMTAPMGAHFVQFDRDPDLSARTILFIERALQAGDGALVVAVPDHRSCVLTTLRSRGVDVEALQGSGSFVLLDSTQILTRILWEGAPNWARFQTLVGETIKGLSRKHGRIHVYDEMAGFLWREGYSVAGAHLEECWERMNQTYAFCLLCAYPLDLSNRAFYPGVVSKICYAHSHAWPGDAHGTFDARIQRTLEELLLPRQVRVLRNWATEKAFSGHHLDPSLRILLWLTEHMPQIADELFRRIRIDLPDAVRDRLAPATRVTP